MKDYLPLVWQELPIYKPDILKGFIKQTAKEHGYKSTLWFGVIRLKDHFFNNWAQHCPWGGIRKWLQRKRGVKIGRNVHWGTNVVVDYPFPNFVIIEDNVSLAGNDYLLAHNKPMEYHHCISDSYVAPIIIRKHAWIAINVTILPGVEIGEGSIISAGSVVSKDIPPLTIAKGSPAKVVADISEVLRGNYSDVEYEKILKERKEKYNL